MRHVNFNKKSKRKVYACVIRYLLDEAIDELNTLVPPAVRQSQESQLPEGHTIHRAARDHNSLLADQKLTVLRFMKDHLNVIEIMPTPALSAPNLTG